METSVGLNSPNDKGDVMRRQQIDVISYVDDATSL